MIKKIYSDLPTFKNLTFNPGLNILLVEKSPGATDLQTRNRAGKTSLIEIIHFLTGSNVDRDSIFKKPVLVDRNFGMSFDLNGSETKVERVGNLPSKVKIIDGDFSSWPIRPTSNIVNGSIVSNNNWKAILGKFFFNLDESDDESSAKNFCPTFRSLFSYFARRVDAGAFETPTKQFRNQNLWDQQVAISYLLGLDWTISQKWQKVRSKEKVLETLKHAIKDGAYGDYIGTASHLRTELTLIEDKIRRFKENLLTFNVLPEYREFERESVEISKSFDELSNDNQIDLEVIEELKKAVRTETPPSYDNLIQVYREAGIFFNDRVLRRFEDVKIFHTSIIENRKAYLSSEIQEIQHRIDSRNIEKDRLSVRMKEIWRILQSHGALDQYTSLQTELTRLEAQAATLNEKLILANQLESDTTELEIERSNLLVQLRSSFTEQDELIRRMILTFQEISSQLYEEAGQLEVIPTSNGPEFKITIQGEQSRGIKNMQIFCFDIMLMQLCSERELGPGFLVHDSHIFDPVDERQTASACKIGAEKAEAFGFQYIVTLNSDKLAQPDVIQGFDPSQYVLPVRLSDRSDDGGLFGVRF